MHLLGSFLLLLLGSIVAPQAMAAADASATLQRLASLVGTWQGSRADGRSHRVDYRLSAGGTVLVETWTLAPGRESLTLYHVDGTDLLATHFCPQGNQPRLQLVSGDDPDTLDFRFRDGSNLQVADKSHQQAFRIRFEADGRFSRSETYVQNARTPAQIAAAQADAAFTYTRVLP